MDELVRKLKKACDDVIADPTMEPRDGKTYCNLAVSKICSIMGFREFIGLLANQIHDYCFKHFKQSENGKWASEYANSGGLCIASQKGEIHGHCAVLYPALMLYSGSWKKDVPVIANVGKINGVLPVSRAFRTEPSYFVIPMEALLK